MIDFPNLELGLSVSVPHLAEAWFILGHSSYLTVSRGVLRFFLTIKASKMPTMPR
jgi:hypothetical protein